MRNRQEQWKQYKYVKCINKRQEFEFLTGTITLGKKKKDNEMHIPIY